MKTVWLFRKGMKLVAYSDTDKLLAESFVLDKLNRTLNDIYPEGWKGFMSVVPREGA